MGTSYYVVGMTYLLVRRALYVDQLISRSDDIIGLSDE